MQSRPLAGTEVIPHDYCPRPALGPGVFVEGDMTPVALQIAEIEKKPVRDCRCGKPFVLVQTMLHIRTGKPLRLFECNCGERHWQE